MKSVTIYYKDKEIAQALRRYFRYVLGLEEGDILVLDDPYGHGERMQKGQRSDLLVVDGFVGKEAKGFAFAKGMEKRVLLLFYPGEIEIEVEGPFWLVLPEGLDRLGDKIMELMELPAPDEEDYKELEARFPEIKERKGHRHN